ncbi:MAG: ribonuclease P protein component [Acidobacteriota bacterium]|nr:ribonuclease P protein component [Acidobacteriota bacterium]
MLSNTQQFRKVYDQGQRFHTSYFSAFILKNDVGELRFGITVTRKIGNAVVRNRCKRRLREALRTRIDLSGLTGDLVLNAKSDFVKAEFTQIVEALEKTIARLRELLSKVDM